MLKRTHLALLLGLGAAVAIPAIGQSVTSFSVTANGASDYSFVGIGLDPTLTLFRGNTYAFNVSANGHPFFIATQGSNPAAPHFTTGVTNENVMVGTLTFAVPASAPSTLFYQCGIHSAMSGTLLIQDPPPPVPALGTLALILLGAMILTAGFYLARRRKLNT
jgi:hypothetical protein